MARNVIQLARLECEHFKTQLFQAFNIAAWIAGNPGQNEIGFKQRHPLQIDFGIIADDRELARTSRVIAIRRYARQLAARAGGEDKLGQMRGEADDAGRGLRERDAFAAIVGDRDGGGCGM